MNSIESTEKGTRKLGRAAGALMAVLAMALVAPFVHGIGRADAAGPLGGSTFSAQVRVTAPCALGGVTLIGLGNADTVDGIFEMQQGGSSGAVWVPGVNTFWTSGPKMPFRFTSSGQNAMLACVSNPNSSMIVTFTVHRAPWIYSIMVPTGSLALAQ